MPDTKTADVGPSVIDLDQQGAGDPAFPGSACPEAFCRRSNNLSALVQQRGQQIATADRVAAAILLNGSSRKLNDIIERRGLHGLAAVAAVTDGSMRADAGGKPEPAESVQTCIARTFGDRLSEVRAAREKLATALSPEELNCVGFRLHERFRLDVRDGAEVGGAKGPSAGQGARCRPFSKLCFCGARRTGDRARCPPAG